MVENLISQLEYYFNERFPNRKEYSKGLAINLVSVVSCNSLKTHITCPIQCKTNLYVTLCGPSNTGKSSIISYHTDLLNAINYRNRLGADVTPEFIPQYLDKNRYAYMRVVELSGLLGSYKFKRYMAGLREMLINAYDGTTLMQGRSTRVGLEAKDYSLCALADIQPDTLSKTADEVDIQSGFLPRFLWYLEPDPAETPPRVATDHVLNIRSEIIKGLNIMFEYAHKNEITFIFKQHHVDEVFHRLRDTIKTDIFAFKPFYERIIMFTYKLSMLYMFASQDYIDLMDEGIETDTTGQWQLNEGNISKKVHEIEITNESVSWAIAYMQQYVDKNLTEIIKTLNLSDADKIVNEVKRYQGDIAQSLLYRNVIHVLKDGRRIEQAIKLGINMGYIRQVRKRGGIAYVLVKDGEEPDVYSYASEDKKKEEEGEE